MKKQRPQEDIVEKNDIPRFVLSLTDTHTIVEGPEGDQYYSINIAADKLKDFNRLIPKAKRTNTARTEWQALLEFFQEAVDDLHKDQEPNFEDVDENAVEPLEAE